MIGSATIALLVLSQASTSNGTYDFNERFKELDQVWVATSDKARRSSAIPKIVAANSAFQANRLLDACKALDEATATLQGRGLTTGDAVSLRFDPPFVEPRSTARLKIAWAYPPATASAVRVQVGRQSVMATPGRELTMEIRPDQVNPDLLQNPEIGYLMPVQVGTEERSVFLSIIKKPKERLAALKLTKQPEAQCLYGFLQKAFDSPENLTGDIPLIHYLFTAELLDEGRLRLERADNLPLVEHKGTFFRATFPRQATQGLNVVIALPNTAGNENTFFDAYGQGRAVTEAMRRNWAFVSARADDSAVEDVVEWIQTRRKQSIANVFVIGHGGNGRLAYDVADLKPRPKAIAALAPMTTVTILSGIPVFYGVGKQDLLAASKAQISQLSPAKGSEIAEFDPCEHWMVAAESIPRAFRFFDQHVGR